MASKKSGGWLENQIQTKCRVLGKWGIRDKPGPWACLGPIIFGTHLGPILFGAHLGPILSIWGPFGAGPLALFAVFLTLTGVVLEEAQGYFVNT